MTDYGTNLDKALMQDYQAAVQENPNKAISFRKEAMTHLNLEVREEKQLAAELLNRIAESCLVLNNLEQAKQYSDKSWSMFRELGLHEKPEILPATCRRGVLLCHVGAETEGLELLHGAETFINKFKSRPSQNRVMVQTALRAAYTAIGNLQEANKYKKL